MRPRFNVRLALLALGVVAAVCYVLFVRPSDVAYRCIKAINNRDYGAARSLARVHSGWDVFDTLRDPSASFVYAEALPREWRDVWLFQHRFIFRVGWKHTIDGRPVEGLTDTQMVAFIDGVEVQR